MAEVDETQAEELTERKWMTGVAANDLGDDFKQMAAAAKQIILSNNRAPKALFSQKRINIRVPIRQNRAERFPKESS